MANLCLTLKTDYWCTWQRLHIDNQTDDLVCWTNKRSTKTNWLLRMYFIFSKLSLIWNTKSKSSSSVLKDKYLIQTFPLFFTRKRVRNPPFSGPILSTICLTYSLLPPIVHNSHSFYSLNSVSLTSHLTVPLEQGYPIFWHPWPTTS